jgi:CRISPR-associated protein Csy1
VERRLMTALSKIKGVDSTAEKERQKQRDFFDLSNLLTSGAGCAGSVQAATHIVKATHPDLKVRSTTNLNIDPRHLVALKVVGSHVLQGEHEIDVTGNGAYNKKIYEVFLLLKSKFGEVTILDLLKKGDLDAINALGDTPEQSAILAQKLSRIDEARCRHLASHNFAKQLYWPVGNDLHDDASFHLLAPLYATSLVHRVYQTVQDDRFSEEAKAARQAKKESKYSARVVREYPQMAIQKLGGTKPQNISQLNSERRGENILFASLPPMWRSIDVKPLLGTESMFPRFSRRAEVRQLVKALLGFLKSDPTGNLETRRRRDEWFDAITDEFLQFRAELCSLPPGWSQEPECHLSSAEKYWLDRKGVEQTLASEGLPLPTDNAERMSALFANWLNAQLRDPLPMGDSEFLEWRNRMYEEIKAEEREGRHDD